MEKKPFIIGIAGGSGSGKTSFIKAIGDRFTREQVCIISQDDYYRTREEQVEDKEGIRNFDRLESIDDYSFAIDIQRLIAGEDVIRKEYTFNNEKSRPQQLVFTPAPIIVIEGRFVFHFERIRDLMDMRIYIHAEMVRKFKRRILRDQTERNYPIADVLYRYEAHVLPAFKKYIEPHRETSDIIINNNERFDLGVEMLEAFIAKKLSE